MSTLYVDVDDTLVHWLGGQEPHPYGFGAETWEWDEGVVDYIEGWIREQKGPVVIWSGGGADYAATWTYRLFGHLSSKGFLRALFDIGYAGKDGRAADDGDVFIDDSPFAAWADRCIHPRDLVRPDEEGLVAEETGGRG